MDLTATLTPVETLSLAAVAVARPVRGGPFTYSVPAALQPMLRPGVRVQVPFGRGSALGFYLGPAAPPQAPGMQKLKPLLRVLETEPALPKDVLELVRFAADHYRYPLGEVLKAALPPGLSQPVEERVVRPEVEVSVRVAEGAKLDALTRAPAQHAALSYLLAVGGHALMDEVAIAIPGAKDALKRLAQKGWVVFEERVLVPGVRDGLEQARPEQLTTDQSKALAQVLTSLDAGGFTPFLLHGVTGSGKTEVYLRAVEHILGQGRGSLILVPEIALTPQLVGRFRSRFGAQVAVLHSALKDAERLLYWRGLRAGELKVAVGVRSAVFAPVENLGLIVVDEEHDPSFKQEEKLRYQARDLAVVRAKQAGATILLGSATPSLETLENVRRGRYRKIELPVRVDDRPLPSVELIDLREQRPRIPLPDEEAPILSPPLREAMSQVLDRGQQVILFLNRRGHSTYLVCGGCGLAVRCDQCDVSLTHHLKIGKVMCHYCGAVAAVPKQCAACHGPLLQLGAGTERVEAEVAQLFPKARVGRLDRDAATSAEKVTELLAAFARRELDVLVGTQMVAKGHDFPGVTLVCVVMADTALALPDFRAAERTFQLLTQVGGRAGRGDEPGRVLIQTYNPDAEAVRRAVTHDFTGFAEQERTWREALAYPPFTRLVAVRIEGADPSTTKNAAMRIGDRIAARMPPASSGVRLLGPSPAPIAKVRGKTRWQLLLKGATHAQLAPLLDAVENEAQRLSGTLRVVVDVDPGAML